jgi:hypothetical protein
MRTTLIDSAAGTGPVPLVQQLYRSSSALHRDLNSQPPRSFLIFPADTLDPSAWLHGSVCRSIATSHARGH